MQRLRSERVERCFAHLCDTGGGRRTWLRGIEKIRKRYLIAAMAHNLGRIMRSLIGAGKPRHAEVLAGRLYLLYFNMIRSWGRLCGVALRAEPLTARCGPDLISGFA